MAGIFNLFGDKLDFDKDQIAKPLSRSKTTLGIPGSLGTPVKSNQQLKPKGLSIRSNSYLNLPNSLHPNQDLCKKDDYLKLDRNGRPKSPVKELMKKPNVLSFTNMTNSSPKKLSANKQLGKFLQTPDELLFKKPLSPKVSDTKYPEKLAHYYDMQLEFDDFYAKSIEEEYEDLLMIKRKKNIVPYEDEGIESDPEPIEFELPAFHITKSDDEESDYNLSLDLPELSDDDTLF